LKRRSRILAFDRRRRQVREGAKLAPRNGGDGRRGPLVHEELKDIRPGIMAHRVDIMAGLHYLCHIEFGQQDPLPVIKRTGQHLAQRGDNRATTAADHLSK
jgi:hypothetical protein